MSSFVNRSARALAQTILTFEGGVPFEKDLAPSIVFIILYALTLPILSWRLLTPRHRSSVLYNAVGHVLFRWIALIMRAYMSRNTVAYHLLLAETIFFTISWLFLVNALCDLMQRHGHSAVTHDASRFGNETTLAEHLNARGATWAKPLNYALEGNLFASLILIITSVALFSSVAEGATFNTVISRMDSSRRLARASYTIGLAALVIATLAVLAIHFTQKRPSRNTGFIFAFAVPLWVSTIYRVVNSFELYNVTTRQLSAFWIALVTMEFIAYVFLHAVSLPEWFGTSNGHIARSSDLEKTALHSNTGPRASIQTASTAPGVHA